MDLTDNYLHVDNISETLIVSSNSHTERLFKVLTNNLFAAGTIKKTNKYLSFKDIIITGDQLDVGKVCKDKLDKLFQQQLGYSEGIQKLQGILVTAILYKRFLLIRKSNRGCYE